MSNSLIQKRAQKLFDLFVPFFTEAKNVQKITFFINEERFNQADIYIDNKNVTDFMDDRLDDIEYKFGELKSLVDNSPALDKETIKKVNDELDSAMSRILNLKKDDAIVDICNKYFDDGGNHKKYPTCPNAHKIIISMLGKIKWPTYYGQNITVTFFRTGQIIVKDDSDNYEYLNLKASSLACISS